MRTFEPVQCSPTGFRFVARVAHSAKRSIITALRIHAINGSIRLYIRPFLKDSVTWTGKAGKRLEKWAKMNGSQPICAAKATCGPAYVGQRFHAPSPRSTGARGDRNRKDTE